MHMDVVIGTKIMNSTQYGQRDEPLAIAGLQQQHISLGATFTSRNGDKFFAIAMNYDRMTENIEIGTAMYTKHSQIVRAGD